MSQGKNATVTDFRLATLESSVAEIRAAVQGIDGSLQKLTSLEERHIAAQEGMRMIAEQGRDHEQRLRVVEFDMPTLRLVRKWVISGVVGCLGLAGVSVWQLVLVANQINKVLGQ